jgi:hypothetical protein
MPELVTLVTRIRCKLAQVATAGFPENFLCTQGGSVYIRKPTSGGGVSTRSAPPYPTGPARSGIHPRAWNGHSPNFALTFSEVRLSTVLGSPLVGTEKAQILKKVRFGGAPVLDEEYGATVTHRGCDEDSVGTVRRGYSSSNNIWAGS